MYDRRFVSAPLGLARAIFWAYGKNLEDNINFMVFGFRIASLSTRYEEICDGRQIAFHRFRVFGITIARGQQHGI